MPGTNGARHLWLFDEVADQLYGTSPARVKQREDISRIEEGPWPTDADELAIRTPRPVLRLVDETGTHRILCDVSHTSEEVLFGEYVRVRVARLEERTASPVPCIELARVPAANHLHPLTQRGLGERDNEVKVIGHETHRVHTPLVLNDDAVKSLQERLTVEVVDEDRAIVDPVGCDVVKASRIM